MLTARLEAPFQNRAGARVFPEPGESRSRPYYDYGCDSSRALEPGGANPRSDTSPITATTIAGDRRGSVAGCSAAWSTSGFPLAARCAIPPLSRCGLLQERRCQAGAGATYAGARAESERLGDAF